MIRYDFVIIQSNLKQWNVQLYWNGMLLHEKNMDSFNSARFLVEMLKEDLKMLAKKNNIELYERIV